MKSIAIICHSGTGGTRVIADLLARRLANIGAVSRLETDGGPAGDGLQRYDLLVFGYPTFYLKPTPSMLDFVEALPRYAESKPALVFTTMAWYAENSLRRFALALRRKSIRVCGVMEFLCPASDGSLSLPPAFFPSLYRFGKNTTSSIKAVVNQAASYLTGGPVQYRIPPVKWYTLVTQTMQIALFNKFDRFRLRLRVYRKRCTDCGFCVTCCPRNAWQREGDDFRHFPDRCELCLRCVHHCPRRAIGWHHRMLDKKRLTPQFYREWTERLEKKL